MKKVSPEVVVRPANHAELPGLACLHQQAFPGFFLTRLGGLFLQKYYAAVVEFDEGILLVAEADGTLLGFVGGFLDPKRFYRTLARRKRDLAPSVCLALAWQPTLAIAVASRVFNLLRGRRQVRDRSRSDCELASLAVHPSAASCGIGSKLVHRFVEEARGRGAGSVYLTTDALRNDSVNRFYRRLGFQRTRCWDETDLRPMNEYVVELRNSV